MSPEKLIRGKNYLYKGVVITFEYEGINYYYFRVTLTEPLIRLTFTDILKKVAEQ